MPKRSMTRWYSVPRLASLGVRAAVSTVFGEFADRRDTMAAERPIQPVAIDPAHDYRSCAAGEFWFDFAADTGDGWDSTYTVARLLAEDTLTPTGSDSPLPRGRILLLGGDQVYPTPSEEDYRDRFVDPFNAAYRDRWPKQQAPDLYAIPGNHDWYDGLSSFLNLFCWRQLKGPWSVVRDGRLIGGRRTQQTRSYFALALPHDWWIWGLDVQLTLYIDQQQINFFDHVARDWMAPGSRLILCTGQPDWAYVDTTKPGPSFSHFTYVERLVDLAQRQHHLCVVLTGDSHHYSRYTEGKRHYITAGGAGAFLHPTHQLRDKIFKWRWGQPGSPLDPPAHPGDTTPAQHRREFRLAEGRGKPRVFPSVEESRLLAWRNLAFAFYNWDYALALGVACAVFAWLLQANAVVEGISLPDALRAPDSLAGALGNYLRLVFASPWPILLVAVAVGGYRYFSDYSGHWRNIAGLLHALAQTAVVVLATILAARHAPGGDIAWILIGYVAVLGGFLAATVMGVYLLISLSCFGVHWNEAFSALRIRHYKCFLRMRIDHGGNLTIFAIGLKDVPSDRGDILQNPRLVPHLIEAPIPVET